MWEKRTTSAEGKTIRIAESSDMDSWEELLRPCAKFCKLWIVLRKLTWKGLFPTCTNELVRGGDGFGTVIEVWLDTGGVPGKQLKWCFLKG